MVTHIAESVIWKLGVGKIRYTPIGSSVTKSITNCTALPDTLYIAANSTHHIHTHDTYASLGPLSLLVRAHKKRPIKSE